MQYYEYWFPIIGYPHLEMNNHGIVRYKETREQVEKPPVRTSFSEMCRNCRIKIIETGQIYDSIWEYMQEFDDKESIVKKCMKYTHRRTTAGHHLVFHEYVPMENMED